MLQLFLNSDKGKIVQLPNKAHLTYCTNVHPGETLSEVISSLQNYVVPVKREIAPDAPFGLGLRLSWQACEQLRHSDRIRELRDFCEEYGLYVFTLNGFSYGHFHGTKVKEQVYFPDWRDERRLEYSNLLAQILAQLLPEGDKGSISTVPVGWRAAFGKSSDVEKAVELLLCHVAELHRIYESAGRTIALALEPEPGCFLENSEDAIMFFQQHILAGNSLERLESLLDNSQDCPSLLQRHLGICYDVCHMSIVHENPGQALTSLKEAGIPVFKIHLSSALKLRFRAGEDIANILRPYAEDIYLHQVVEKCGERLQSFNDLPLALQSLFLRREEGPIEWRIHFHVPIFLENMGRLATTQGDLIELCAHWRDNPVCRHLEVETYTWEVLPREYRGNLVKAIERELRWAMAKLE